MMIREQIKLINIAISRTLNIYGTWAKKNDLNYNSLAVLYTLFDYKVCTQRQICECWGLPKQTVHGILHDFVTKGYVNIAFNKLNKREKLISFTAKGMQYAKKILEPLHKMEEAAMKQLGQDICQQLVDSNTIYYEMLKKEMEKE